MTHGSARLHLMYNARIWQSGVDDQPDKTWMMFNVDNGFIASTGIDDPPINFVADNQRTDCNGRRILPGLHESHIHIGFLGRSLNSVDLQKCKSIDEFQERVGKFIGEHADLKWIVGRGWEQDLLGRYPNKQDLDAVCPDKPIYMVRICGHIAVANSLALQLSGINNDTADPPGGHIERSQDNNETTGLLFENALDMVNQVTTPTLDEWTTYIEKALRLVLRNGATSVHACELHTWRAFCRLADEGRLPIRVFYAAYYDESERLPSPGEARGPLLSCDRVKLFADGALGVATAAMSRPYLQLAGDGRCNHGMLLLTQEEMTGRVQSATSSGYRVEIHAIGDQAADVALTALETVDVAPEKRPILIHCQILRADLIGRMRSRGVIASIQPQFVHTDCRWLSKLLPSESLHHAYVWKSLVDQGVVCAGGSDAPVEKPEPLTGIYDAIFRRVDRQPSGEQFKSEECLTVRQAIDLYTIAGAYTTMQEHRLGRLLPGYQADFIVLDKDVCSIPDDLLSASVVEAWVAGQRRL